MDEYTREIADLERQVERLVDADGDAAVIADLTIQLEILRALLSRAAELYGQGLRDPALQVALRMRGFGDWSFENVYAFVYETSVDVPSDGHRSFLADIRATDFTGILEESAAPGPID